jgi:uncharacterized protein YbjT (DUF2867 family)
LTLLTDPSQDYLVLSLLSIASAITIGTMTKLICILGVTGNQGGSVAHRFLKDPNYHVRGLTRNPASPAAQKLALQGVDIVQADLDDAESLIPAFTGAQVIFSVTNYWEPFFWPDC